MNALTPSSITSQTPPALSRWATVVLLALAGASAAQAQNLVTLYDTARNFDASILAARAQFEASEARAAQARAGLLPQAGLSAAAQWARRDSGAAALEGTSNSQNAAVSASHPLYRPVNQINNDQAQLALEVAKAQLDAAEQDLMVRTTQAYFDVLAAEDTLTVIKAQKTAVAEQLAAAKRNFEVGTSTVTDSREAQARFDLVLAQEIATENDLRVKKLALDQLVGQQDVKPQPLAAPVSLPALVPTELADWVAQAQSKHPTVLQASKGLEIAQLETRKAQAGEGPTVDLVGQYQWARSPISPYPSNIRTTTASVGVQFNMPLYTGGAVQNRIKETLALQEKARNDLQAAQRGVSQATRAAYFGVLSGLGQVKALETAEVSSQSALDANKLGYQVGVRINIDVLNAQSQLYQTRRDLSVARYNVLVGGLRLKQASGQLSAQDLQAVNALLAR